MCFPGSIVHISGSEFYTGKRFYPIDFPAVL